MPATIPDHAASELLQALVRAPSPSGRERPAVEALNAALLDLGFDSVRSNEAGNASGSLRCGERLALVLNGHIDPVPTGDRDCWPVDPLAAMVQEEVAGLGARWFGEQQRADRVSLGERPAASSGHVGT